MKPFALASATLFALVLAAPAFGQQPNPGWSYPTFAPAAVQEPLPPAASPPVVPQQPAFPTFGPDRPAPAEPLPPIPENNGQQHWVSLNMSVLQPFAGRLGVKVWSRENNSVWLEASVGSVLFDFMVGFGVRVQHTAFTFGSGDRLMVSPGLGVHVLPAYTNDHSFTGTSHNAGLTYLVADADLSWLHDFSPHFGFELGMKLGIAGKVAGTLGRYPRAVMFGRDCYPIIALYSGFRF